jgi:D-serine deaminase-like pyridoxal phosphate-dependent protein
MWYQLDNPEEIISPSLLFYKDRIESNIQRMVHIAGGPERLVPHIKTHKNPDIVRLQLAQGITKFKCATIAEAEMLAQTGAKWILIAYQLVGPNVKRIFRLKELYPDIHFASLLDSEMVADQLDQASARQGTISQVFIDVNNGMNRSGHAPGASILELYRHAASLQNITVSGLHVYDGHIHDSEFQERKVVSESAYELVLPLIDLIRTHTGKEPVIVVGGSPTFTVHTLRENVFLSPGTSILWDSGYGDSLHDQPFQHAALVLTRIISKPKPGTVTIDLGHKAIASENPIGKRFRLLNLPQAEVISQSEEHGVLLVPNDVWDKIQIGDTLYALPYHICPTVALHDYATVIQDGKAVNEWKIVARSRRLTI